MFSPHFLTSDSVNTTVLQKLKVLALISVSGLHMAQFADWLRLKERERRVSNTNQCFLPKLLKSSSCWLSSSRFQKIVLMSPSTNGVQLVYKNYGSCAKQKVHKQKTYTSDHSKTRGNKLTQKSFIEIWHFFAVHSVD